MFLCKWCGRKQIFLHRDNKVVLYVLQFPDIKTKCVFGAERSFMTFVKGLIVSVVQLCRQSSKCVLNHVLCIVYVHFLFHFQWTSLMKSTQLWEMLVWRKKFTGKSIKNCHSIVGAWLCCMVIVIIIIIHFIWKSRIGKENLYKL